MAVKGIKQRKVLSKQEFFFFFLIIPTLLLNATLGYILVFYIMIFSFSLIILLKPFAINYF